MFTTTEAALSFSNQQPALAKHRNTKPEMNNASFYQVRFAQKMYQYILIC